MRLSLYVRCKILYKAITYLGAILSDWAPEVSLIPNTSMMGMSSDRKNFLISAESGAAPVANVKHWSSPKDSFTLLNTIDLAIL